MSAPGYEELTGGSGYQGSAPVLGNIKTDNDNHVPVLSFVRKLWAGFHNAIITALMFTLLGIGVGVKASHQFYLEKINEVVQTGAMLHNKKVYTISPKL